MITWVQINTQPIYTFYTVEKVKEVARLSGLAFRRLLSISAITRPCSISGGSESASLSVTLRHFQSVFVLGDSNRHGILND
jgi:hypothetical protein